MRARSGAAWTLLRSRALPLRARACDAAQPSSGDPAGGAAAGASPLAAAQAALEAAHQEVLADQQRLAARLPAGTPAPAPARPPSVQQIGGRLTVSIPLPSPPPWVPGSDAAQLLSRLDALLWRARVAGLTSAISSAAHYTPSGTTYTWQLTTHSSGSSSGSSSSSSSSQGPSAAASSSAGGGRATPGDAAPPCVGPFCPLPGRGSVLGQPTSTLTVRAQLSADPGDPSWLRFQKEGGAGFTPGELQLIAQAMALAAGVAVEEQLALGLPPWMRLAGGAADELRALGDAVGDELRRALGSFLGGDAADRLRRLLGGPGGADAAGPPGQLAGREEEEFARWLEEQFEQQLGRLFGGQQAGGGAGEGGAWDAAAPQLPFPQEPLPAPHAPKQLPAPAVEEHEWGSRAADLAARDLTKMGCTVIPPGSAATTDWGMLAGYEEAKAALEDCLLLPLQHPEVYDAVAEMTRGKERAGGGSSRPRAVLFEGPPGTGKTTSARVIGAQAAVPLVYVPLEAVVSKWYGESEQNLAKVFKAAGAMGGVIIFLDEMDSLAPDRENPSSHEASRRMLSVLLREIDGFEAGPSGKRSVVIGATNRKSDLDAALLSRFDMSVHFPLPDEPCRAAILAQYARQLSKEELGRVAAATPGFSGRDLRDVAEQAERRWAAKVIRRQVEAGTAPSLAEYLAAAEERLAAAHHIPAAPRSAAGGRARAATLVSP